MRARSCCAMAPNVPSARCREASGGGGSPHGDLGLERARGEQGVEDLEEICRRPLALDALVRRDQADQAVHHVPVIRAGDRERVEAGDDRVG